jgi:uncharacterized protein YutE (UPF0331/DUF86 family)
MPSGSSRARKRRTRRGSPPIPCCVERWLQVAIEACVDIASYVIADQGWTPPATGRDAFLALSSHGRLPLDLAERLGSAVGLRNLLVHDYVIIDLSRLARVVGEDLGDLRDFARTASSWVDG